MKSKKLRMPKFWKIPDSKSNNLILIKDKTVYKGNIKPNDLSRLNTQASHPSPLDNLFSIPYSYIRRIENQAGKNEIKIYFGNDSIEELIVKDKAIKQEIFDYLKSDLSDFKYATRMPSILNYGRPQFFALLLMTAIFIWSLYLAIQIENGVEYELIGSGRSISAIVLMLANLGTAKNVMGFLIVLSIIFFSLKRRLKSRSEIEILER